MHRPAPPAAPPVEWCEAEQRAFLVAVLDCRLSPRPTRAQRLALIEALAAWPIDARPPRFEPLIDCCHRWLAEMVDRAASTPLPCREAFDLAVPPEAARRVDATLRERRSTRWRTKPRAPADGAPRYAWQRRRDLNDEIEGVTA